MLSDLAEANSVERERNEPFICLLCLGEPRAQGLAKAECASMPDSVALQPEHPQLLIDAQSLRKLGGSLVADPVVVKPQLRQPRVVHERLG